jgi:hypothetical protein
MMPHELARQRRELIRFCFDPDIAPSWTAEDAALLRAVILTGRYGEA